MDQKSMIESITTHSLYVKYRLVILYALIGGFCAFLDFSIYSLLTFSGINYLLSNAISVHVGIFCSFFLNSQYNFKIKNKKKIRFVSFYSIGLIGLALSSILLKIMIEGMFINEIVAKLAVVFIVAAIQFFLNKFITFKK